MKNDSYGINNDDLTQWWILFDQMNIRIMNNSRSFSFARCVISRRPPETDDHHHTVKHEIITASFSCNSTSSRRFCLLWLWHVYKYIGNLLFISKNFLPSLSALSHPERFSPHLSLSDLLPLIFLCLFVVWHAIFIMRLPSSDLRFIWSFIYRNSDECVSVPILLILATIIVEMKDHCWLKLVIYKLHRCRRWGEPRR